MHTPWVPKSQEVYFISRPTMLYILEGQGFIQVDFKNYLDWENKLFFLEEGQYIKFLTEGFTIYKFEFTDTNLLAHKDIRVLFKHLVSLGHINLDNYFKPLHGFKLLAHAKPREIIHSSSQKWYQQNPFQANKEEYTIIFDVKEAIDKHYHDHLSNQEIKYLLRDDHNQAQRLYKSKVGITIKNLLTNKRLLESKKDIAFSDKSIKEVAYALGYKDPAYFNRVFKINTGCSPREFRKQMEFARKDSFLMHLYDLIQNFHHQERQAEFYAQKLNMSVKTLSKKVKDRLHISLGQLIRQEIITKAKKYLADNQSIQEVAFTLGFEEPNHFSAFFKHYTGQSPSNFQDQKYHE